MKKNYTILKTFIVLLSFFTLRLSAQLSGIVTINSGAATAGTNYQTFTALANVLNSNGVSGPLTVNVVASSGPYTEQPSFSSIVGTSATNTITVNGNGCLLTFNSTNSSQPWVLGIGGADYMNFNNLNIQGTGTYAYACILYNSSNYNSFTTCTFSVPTNGTSSSQIPVVLSGSGTTYGSFGDNGNYNTWKGCTMSGGYYGISLYGNSSGGVPTGNSIINCLITDWYTRGIYHYYMHKNTTITGNTIQRPTRTTSTTTYAIYTYYSQGTIIERNRIQNLYDNQQTSTSTCYGIYMYYNPSGGGKANPNWIRNNIISDIKHNGTIYGIMALYIDGYVYHNTLSFDNASSTGGSVYGIYTYSQSNFDIFIKNNNISMTRGGTGTKYCFYSGGNTSYLTVDKNNYYLNAPSGTNYIGYYSGPATTLSSLQAQGTDLNSFSTNPGFTNPAAQNYIPTSTVINNQGAPVGIYVDINLNPRSGTTPDIGAHEFLSLNCSGTPSANAVSPASFTICPGDFANLGLANYYSDLGITYHWQASTTSSVGPWTSYTAALASATTGVLSTPNLTASTWFGVVMTCTNGNGSITPVGYVNVAGTTTSTVPYFEGFEGINGTNKLPNCSWTSNSLGTNCLTYTTNANQNRNPHTGSRYASFYTSYITGSNYFYTNGIYLNAGVTYSASLWFETEYYGYTNVTDLSILLGTSQSTTGLVTIASTNGPAASSTYKSLSNTFTVATAGLYYVAVRATSSGNYGVTYLSWDDLQIIAPCSLNSPTVSLSANSTTICQGQTINLTAAGADTYTWSNGINGSVDNDTPNINTIYSVVGTNTLSGCSVTVQSQLIVVNPSPNLIVHTGQPTLCIGKTTQIVANGASSYTWNTSSSNAFITVSPTITTTYTVLGSNAYNCVSTGTQQITVIPGPVVTITSGAPDPNQMCKGETVTLTGNGAVSYSWAAATLYIQSPQALVSPQVTTTYTLTGTGTNGCDGKTTITLNVSDCTGLNKMTTTLSGLKVYPNPTEGLFIIELSTASPKTIEVSDVTGRLIMANTSNDEKVNVNIKNLANGIYYVKIQSDNSVEVIKVVKQ